MIKKNLLVAKKMRIVLDNGLRDISWLAFNERVLQEAADTNVPLAERIKFLGIFSNNLDEFFRVRVATLNRLARLDTKAKSALKIHPTRVINKINNIVVQQQGLFERTWIQIQKDLKNFGVKMVTNEKLNPAQAIFVENYFNEFVSGNIIPLMLDGMKTFPTLNDKSIYLACTLKNSNLKKPTKFALISVPARRLPRFVIIPSIGKETNIILLEDIIRHCMPEIFSVLGYDTFSAHIIKVTRDAELDIDNDPSTPIIQKLEKSIKERKSGKLVRLVYDKNIEPTIFAFLVQKLGLGKRDSLIAGGRIHNFKDFFNFPEVNIPKAKPIQSLMHPALRLRTSLSAVLLKQDVLLSFPYHSFDSIVDLLREAAIDPDVTSIKMTCYRLATRSKIINALTNAVRNGKKVVVMLELKARFDEEANIEWKEELEDAGVQVLLGVDNFKVHAKLCVITRIQKGKTQKFGFVSTGNFNEKTAKTYSDFCLLTSNKMIMADAEKVFSFLQNPKFDFAGLKMAKTLLLSPVSMRTGLTKLIEAEVRNVRKGIPAAITLKMNSLSDGLLIRELEHAAKQGVVVRLIVRGIYCLNLDASKKIDVRAISIIDEYLEHARVLIFGNNGDPKVYISSADFMTRNIDHRVEAACPILDGQVKEQILAMINIQLADNQKARILNKGLSNEYVHENKKPKIRSQQSIYNYLKGLTRIKEMPSK